MDEATVDLILALQIQDIKDAEPKLDGKDGDTDEPSDAELAARLQQEEDHNASTVESDRRIARSIAKAVQDDGANVVILASEEKRIARDRELAQRLSGHYFPLPYEYQVTDRDMMVRYRDYNTEDSTEEVRLTTTSVERPVDDQPEGSASAATRKAAVARVVETQWWQCVSCQEMRDVIEMPCHHLYCQDCTQQLFAGATDDEALFPPRCCRQNIPVSLAQHFLDSDPAVRFEEKSIEYGTPNRTYCSDPSCALFIDPSRIDGSTGSCPNRDCCRFTCVLCKAEAHTGSCPKDDALAETVRLAQDSGWQRCQRCQNMVELVIGCNHMT